MMNLHNFYFSLRLCIRQFDIDGFRAQRARNTELWYFVVNLDTVLDSGMAGCQLDEPQGFSGDHWQNAMVFIFFTEFN